MSPAERYRLAVRDGDAEPDAAQARAVEMFEALYEALVAVPVNESLLSRLGRRVTGNVQWPPVTGLYLWGEVGRGKTWLMDLFHDALPFEEKARVHFHRFMLAVHDRLKSLGNVRDPLVRVAREIAAQRRVLCLDELFVSDIADAMILGRLFENLFESGVTLVATSNTPPDGLYAGGLQRQRFLPAIDALKANMELFHLDAPADYRLRVLEAAELYLAPADARADERLVDFFCRI